MLTCITCSKQEDRDDEDAPRGISGSKDAVKSLTSQIKDIALKVSGAHKGKSDVEESRFKGVQHSYSYFDSISDGVRHPYLRPGSSGFSTPAWDYDKITGHNATPRFTAFSHIKPPGRTESISSKSSDVLLAHESEPKEWMAQVEPGVQITFVSLPEVGMISNESVSEMFDKWQAQRWWGENYDRIMELYNVQRFNQQALNTPGRSEDGRDSSYSCCRTEESPRMTPAMSKEWTQRSTRFPQEPLAPHPANGNKAEMEASRATTSSRDEASVSISNASEIETEWMEEDEPGVYITIRQLIDGTRELRRVRFSRDRFGEVRAKLWWETNRDRILSQYLCQQ